MTAENSSTNKSAVAENVETARTETSDSVDQQTAQAQPSASTNEPALADVATEDAAAPAPHADSGAKPTAAAEPVATAAAAKPAATDAAKPASSPGKPTPAAKAAPAAKPAPPPTPFKAEPSLPISMINLIDEGNVSMELGERRFRGELEEDFDEALERVELASRRRPLRHRLKGFFTWLRPTLRPAERATRTERRVAFDGFHTDLFHASLYDEKTERDRRYGTVYTVSEEINAYLVRLEFPRKVPNSSLKRMWNLPDEMPDYEYTISQDQGVLTIRAGVRGEAFRRLSYVSSSFPSDFMTQLRFEKAVAGFNHRLRNKVLEIIVFKAMGNGLRTVA